MSILSLFKGNVKLIAISTAIFAFGERMVMPYLSLYILELGGDATTIGLVNSLGSIGSVFLLPIGGYIADYKGRVKLVAIMSYLYACSSLFFIFATSWQALTVGLFLQRLSLIYTPALSALQADSLPPERRGIGYGLFRTVPSIAGLMSPYIAGYLATVYGMNHAMRIGYACVLVCGLIAGTIRSKIRETLMESRSIVPISNFPSLFVTSYKMLFGSLKGIPRTMWIITAVSAMNSFFFTMAGPFWVVYATEIIKLSAMDWGKIIMAMTGLRIVLSIPAGRVIDIVGRKNVILVSLFLMPIPILLFVYSKTFLQVLAVALFIEILDDFLMPAVQALIADLIKRDQRGLVNSALGRGVFNVTFGGEMGGGTLVMYLPSMAGAILGGMIYMINPVLPWLLLAPSMVVCAVLTALIIHEPAIPEE